MAINMLQLPGYNPGQAADWSPVHNALDSNQRLAQQQNQFNAQNKLQQAQLGMQQERLGMEREQHTAQQSQIMAQRVGGMAQMGLQEKDPARRMAILDRIISMHPDKSKLGPEYLSPDTAFPMLVQEAEGFRGQKDQAAIGLTRAQTAAAYAQADRARRENTETGLVPQYMVGEDGKVQPFVMNKKGQPVPVQLPQGMRALGPGGIAAERERGKWEGGGDKRLEGRERLTTVLGGLAQDYMTLDRTGGIVNPDRGAMDSLAARAKSTGIGQTIAGATGSKEQSIRQQINNSRPLLIQGIMQATGMSARALDSNRELDFYLSAVSDPTKDLHSNLVAIDVIDKTYGLGNVLQSTIPPELYQRISRDAQRAMATRPIPKDTPDGAGSFSPPAQSGWGIRRME